MGFAGKVMNGSGIEIYYAIGAIIFMTLFIVIVIRTMRMKKKDLMHIKTSILEDGDTDQTNNING